jgi:SAM-dependent methyltransferase
MTERHTSLRDAGLKTKKVPIQERSVLVGDIIFVNGYGVSRTALQQRFAEGGYQAQETPHFLLFTRSKAPTTILVHWFAPEEVNADIKHYVMLELKPLGLLTQSRHFGEILAGIIGSFFPEDVRRAWRYFGTNTLQRFLMFLSTVSTPPYPDYTTIGSFVTQYQRICELCVGTSFLDAGCESGFLPLLIAERMPFMEHVVGVDIRSDMFPVMREFAADRRLHQVHYVQADLLADEFCTLGQFDTVTALGVVEHFTEEETYRLLTNLLNVTLHRLILTVPYEQEPEMIYEHKQVFTPAKLERLGAWCLHHIADAGRMWCEDCVGGLLLIERTDSIRRR